ncbi:MAG: hypothetical protein GC162_10785 [Planctomycetes bacterium]|nr:hypothetical protein [Planctomycetota bacterium]
MTGNFLVTFFFLTTVLALGAAAYLFYINDKQTAELEMLHARVRQLETQTQIAPVAASARPIPPATPLSAEPGKTPRPLPVPAPPTPLPGATATPVAAPVPTPSTTKPSVSIPDLLPPLQGPPTFAGNATHVALPAKYGRWCLAGCGRFIIVHMPEAHQVAVIDVLAGGILHTFDGVTDDVIPAAGRNWMVLVLPSQQRIVRYRLDNFERDKVGPLPTDGTTRAALIGYASNGPLLIGSNKGHLVDLLTLESDETRQTIGGQDEYGYSIRVSADGLTFGGIPLGIGPIAFTRMMLLPASTDLQNFSSTSGAYRYAQPNADGSLMFMTGHALYNANLKEIPTTALNKRTLFPTDDPRYFIALEQTNIGAKKEGLTLEICTVADRRVIATIKGFEEWGRHGNHDDRGRSLWLSEGVFEYLVHPQVFVVTDVDRKTIHLYKLNVLDEMAKRGDYLYVESVPPCVAKRGVELVYRVEAQSSKGPVVCTLASAPPGAIIDPDGTIRWTPPADFANDTAAIIADVSDASGEHVLHNIDLDVQ